MLDIWLGIWFLVQTSEEKVQTEKDAAQDIRAICKLIEQPQASKLRHARSNP